MRIGIVAEYNPFHNGHKYQIEYAKNVLKADSVVIAMSGNFTQRGLPAVCDKQIRADVAVDCGADIVVEMPLSICTADTPLFAQGAVDILNRLGCDSILFGSELNNLDLLYSIAEIMTSKEYEKLYFLFLIKNHDAPLSRELAIKKLISNNNIFSFSFINEPNNLLGIYYLSAIIRRGYNITPYTNKRVGQGYFDEEYITECKFASASAIRKLIANEKSNSNDAFSIFIPDEMYDRLVDYFNLYRAVFIEQFENEILKSFQECSQEKWNNICIDNPREAVPFSAIKAKLSNNASYAEVRQEFLKYVSPLRADRMICWILLDQKRLNINEFTESDHTYYRVLASNKKLKIDDLKNSFSVNQWKMIDDLYIAKAKLD